MVTALRDEILSDPTLGKEAKNHGCSNLKEEFSVPNWSSDSEESEIFQLKRRIWKDQMLLRKLERNSKEPAELCTEPSQSFIVTRNTNAKTLTDGVLHYMLKVMRERNARGFVYGILPRTGPPITGSSDSLRAWWNDTVAFTPDLISPGSDSKTLDWDSYIHKLQDIKDDTIGSIISALIQYCQPPQRSFPFDQGLAPSWWPTGKEIWWGLQGQGPAQLGAPPYRKPHDLRKGWKLSVLAAVIKHMSPRFDEMRSLVSRSKNLQNKMSTNDASTWCSVLSQEEALVERTKQSLVISDDGSSSNAHYVSSEKEKADGNGRGSGTGTGKERESCWEGDLWPNVDLDMKLIDELMSFYEQACMDPSSCKFYES